MSAFEELMRVVHEEEERHKNRKDWELLAEKILNVTDPDEIIKMQDEIDSFMESNATRKEKKLLEGYLECYYMKLDAVLPEGIIAAGIIKVDGEER